MILILIPYVCYHSFGHLTFWIEATPISAVSGLLDVLLMRYFLMAPNLVSKFDDSMLQYRIQASHMRPMRSLPYHHYQDLAQK